MNLKIILTLTLISTLIILSAGCITYIEESESGTTKVNSELIFVNRGEDEPITIDVKRTVDIDMYKDGIHITGQAIYLGDKLIKMDCEIDGYHPEYGHCSGTMTQIGDNEPIYNIEYDIDMYEDGLHIFGTMRINGEIDNPDNMCFDLIISGYKDGCRVSGIMIGCNPSIKITMTVHHPIYGDYTETTYDSF